MFRLFHAASFPFALHYPRQPERTTLRFASSPSLRYGTSCVRSGAQSQSTSLSGETSSLRPYSTRGTSIPDSSQRKGVSGAAPVRYPNLNQAKVGATHLRFLGHVTRAPREAGCF